MNKTINQKSIREELLSKWETDSKYILAYHLEKLLTYEKTISEEQKAQLQEYRNLFSWKQTYSVNATYPVQYFAYEEKTTCSSLEEALAYQSGKKELKFPNEDEIDWVEFIYDNTNSPSLSGHCDIAIQIGVEELTLKVPPQPKQKTWKIFLEVLADSDLEDTDLDSFCGQVALLAHQ